MRKSNFRPKPSYPSPHDHGARDKPNPKIETRATRIGQLAVFLIGGSRVFAGEVTEIDTETGQILAAYITGGRMLRFTLGKPPTSKLLPPEWTDKQTVFSLCPRNGWESFVQARDALVPLYEKWKLEQIGVKSLKETVAVDVEDAGLTDEQRRAWLAKYSIPRPTKAANRTKDTK